MARIAFLDDSFPFTGATFRAQPLGGIQTATVMLAETLASHGHHVAVHGMLAADEKHEGVVYRPLFTPWGETYDLVVANCVAKLFSHARGKRRALWMHGPARYMRKPRHLWPYLKFRPSLVFLGEYHRSTWPAWIPAWDPSVIPHGVGEPFISAPRAASPPGPRAIFLSNPRRNLDWILDVWAKHIHPAMPLAQLHVYAGRSNYGSRRDDKLDKAVALAESFAGQGVVRHDPLPKSELARAMGESRVMLYRGDPGETFCFAAAEAQAAGVPLVTAGIGSLAERVVDGKTGFLREDPESFAAAALRLLQDDDLWRAQREAAQGQRDSLSWQAAASAWEERFGLESA